MTHENRPVVAIDGPAGAGKSTISKRVADALGFLLVDTGAIYRSVALAALREDLLLDDDAAVGALAKQLADTSGISLECRPGGGVCVTLRGEDVSEAIRLPENGMAASRVSALPKVREALLAMQRALGKNGGVVLEGRDIGTVVFPDAEVKFFLTARPEIRAARRHAELGQKGIVQTFSDTLREVVERDRQDESRPIAPLRKAEDAVLVDASDETIDQVVARMVDWVRARQRLTSAGPESPSVRH